MHSEKSLPKPLEIAIFTWKMTSFGYKNEPLWTTLAHNGSDIGSQINELSETFYFLKKSLDLVELYACFYILSDISESEIGPFPAL